MSLSLLLLRTSTFSESPHVFTKGHSSKFRVGSRIRLPPEEGRRTYRPKRCRNNYKDENSSPKILNDKNHQASFQKFRQPRMMFSSFNSNPTTITISVYRPTNANDKTEIITFNNELRSLVCSIPKDVLIIGGAMNAHIIIDETNKSCLYYLSKRNREYLTDFSLKNRLTCLNIKLQKRWGDYVPTPTQIMVKHRCLHKQEVEK